MKNLFLGLALTTGVAGAASAQDIKLCHIANSGFMAEGRSSAVLFDAARLVDTFDGDYAMPSKELMAELIPGEGAFGKVTVALVSHNHNDHYDPVGTLAHLRGNSRVHYVMPPEAYDMLKAQGPSEEELVRVHVVLPDWAGGPVVEQIADVTIEAYRVSHGEDAPQNIGYRVSLDGVHLFHTGDIAADKESLLRSGLGQTEVDIMLMPFWFGFNNPEQVADAAEVWQIDTVVPMHFAPKPERWMKEFGGFEPLVEKVHGQWPKSRRVLGEMACETFSY